MEKEFRKPDEPDPPRPEDFPVQTDELKELEEQAKRRGDMDAARWMSERVSLSICLWCGEARTMMTKRRVRGCRCPFAIRKVADV